MVASAIILILVFVIIVALIITEKVNRAVLSMCGALVTFFVLTFLEGKEFGIIIELLFGTEHDGYVNFHSLLLILGIMFIVQIAEESGTIQFVAIYAIKTSKGKPFALMSILSVLAVIFSAILNDILTVIILIPLTITISRMIDIDPTPYILCQAMLVNVGGTLFAISSIPNILITTYTGITFIEFFIHVGLFSIVTVGITLGFFFFLFNKHLVEPEEQLINNLENFNPWNAVQSKRLFYSSLGSIGLLMLAFLFIPTDFLPPSVIALSIAMGLTLISTFSGLEAVDIIQKFDYELLFYLLGIFIVTGGLEVVGVIDALGAIFRRIGAGAPVFQIVALLWFSSYASAMMENVPITQVLIPVVNIVTEGSPIPSHQYFYSMTIGVNWGDNLTPIGDNMLVIQLAKKNQRPISVMDFWRFGFVVTNIQLVCATIYLLLVLKFLVGLLVLLSVLAFLTSFIMVYKFSKPKTRNILKRILENIRRITPHSSR